ncbi:ATP-binding cassette domain-containing protein [Yoonia sp. SS1-5]|uniref:ABC transporter ATP-binding protein n=1 Tax=Yoonia rhodophyticola TaxID=3137370 RepID=A0AAN0MC82_9RHOB
MEALITCPALKVSLQDAAGVFTLQADDFRITPGEAVAITGPSGSGKSLFLEALSLVRRPDDGSAIVFHFPDGDIAPVPFWDAPGGDTDLAFLRRKRFGFVPQTGELLPFLSVRENIMLSQQMNGITDTDFVAYLLDRLDLTQAIDAATSRLSVGERQRVAIARALAHRPAIIIADEPTAPLDPQRSDVAVRLLVELAKAQDAALILSTHDMGIARGHGLTRWVCAVGGNEDHVISRLIPHAQSVAA